MENWERKQKKCDYCGKKLNLEDENKITITRNYTENSKNRKIFNIILCNKCDIDFWKMLERII